MQVQDLMSPSTVTVEPQSTAETAAKLFSRYNVGALPVCTSDRRLHGMITDRDIVLRCIAPQENPRQVQVGDIMTKGCVTVAPTDDCAHAARLMADKQIRRLPVVENGKMVGMLSLGDLAKSQRYDMEAAQALAEIAENILRPQSSGGGQE